MAMKHKSISTAHRVKEIVENFDSDHIFATQDLLRLIDFGSRNAIDLILSRLVRENILVRLARGVFVKKEADSENLTPFKIATVKAKAFGKSIQLYGEAAARKVGMIYSNREVEAMTKMEDVTSTKSKHTHTSFKELAQQVETIYTFYTSGSSSSFKLGNSTVRFISASHRKRELPDSVSGMVLKAVWYYGHLNVTSSKVKARYIAFNQDRDKIHEFRNYVRTLPKWIVKNLYPAVA